MFKKCLVFVVLLIGMMVAMSFGGQVPAKPARLVGMIPDATAKVHMGQVYRTGQIFKGIADGATAYFLVDVSTSGFTADEIHAVLAISVESTAILNIYKDPIVNSSGTVVPSYNLNQSIADSATAIMYVTPTIVTNQNGTKISPTILMPAGNKNFNSGIAFRDGAHYVWADALYLITVRNEDGQAAKDIGIYSDFYEHLDP